MIYLLAIAFKSAIRNFKKSLWQNTLNILGLSAAFATIFVIGIYVFHEKNYENFHQNRERVYRVTYEFNAPDFNVHWARIPVTYINQLPEEISGIRSLVRFQNQEQKYFRFGEKKFKAESAYQTDPNVFEVFSFPFVKGDHHTALSEPYSIVLSESEAMRMFGNADVVGQAIEMSGSWSEEEKSYTITGIMNDLPSNTHLPVKCLYSFSSPEERRGWAYTYLLLDDHSNIQQVEKASPSFVANHLDDPNSDVTLHYQSLQDIHLQSQLAREIKPNGSIAYVKIFIWVAFFIWFIAVINYSNLHLATAMNRSQEIGVRKILGADSQHLSWQILGENTFQTLIAVLLGGVFLIVCFPPLTAIVGPMEFPPLSTLIFFVSCCWIVTVIMSSITPIFIARATGILQAMQKKLVVSKKFEISNISIRRALIAFQFVSAVILISATYITVQQFEFLHQKDLGINTSQVVALPAVPNPVTNKFELLKNEISSINGVLGMTACMQVPSSSIRDSGPVRKLGDGAIDDDGVFMDIQIIEPEFVSLMGLKVLAGNVDVLQSGMTQLPEFSEDLTPQKYLEEKPRHYVINETAAKKMGWEDPKDAIGKQINFEIGSFNLDYGPVVAVTQDYFQESLRQEVEPTIMMVEPIWLQTFLIKLSTQNMAGTLSQIEKTWDQHVSYALEYHFVDELFAQLYHQDETRGRLLTLFAILATFVAFLGLSNLLSITLQRRTKELAIRKVVGASLANLTTLIGREYLGLLALGLSLGIPISMYWMSEWLDTFAYHAPLHPLKIVLVVLPLFVILIVLVLYRVVRLSRNNPMRALRQD